MLTASAKFRPALAWFARQIAPSVLATLIAALVIAGYNRAFSGHLQQPRMAALHAAMDKVAGEPAAAEADASAKPKPAWTTRVVEIIAPTGDIERSFDKDEGREAAKDQSKLKVADLAPAAVPAPVAPRAVVARPRLLLADEPTSRLDGANAISVAILLGRLARSTGAAVACATHDPLVIEQADSQISLS